MTFPVEQNVQRGAAPVSVSLPSDWTVNERQLCDLEMIISGAFAPLQGFMGISDYQRYGAVSLSTTGLIANTKCLFQTGLAHRDFQIVVLARIEMGKYT